MQNLYTTYVYSIMFVIFCLLHSHMEEQIRVSHYNAGQHHKLNITIFLLLLTNVFIELQWFFCFVFDFLYLLVCVYKVGLTNQTRGQNIDKCRIVWEFIWVEDSRHSWILFQFLHYLATIHIDLYKDIIKSPARLLTLIFALLMSGYLSS